jgi:hypothetical protein
MSSEGFRGVPGVPDGWELVEVRKVRYMENYIWTSGYSSLWQDSEESDFVVPIIRKIEQPAKYRAFANGAEFIADERDRVGVDWKQGDAWPGFFAVVSANSNFVWVAFGDVIKRFDWEKAFEDLKFRHADNSTSPFGVKIDD